MLKIQKILDYGKYKFEQEKKLRDSKKNQKVLKLKEIRMQPKIGSGDLDTKAKHTVRTASIRRAVSAMPPAMTPRAERLPGCRCFPT